MNAKHVLIFVLLLFSACGRSQPEEQALSDENSTVGVQSEELQATGI